MHLLLSLIYNLATSFVLLKLSEATQCQSNDFAQGRFVQKTIAIANLTADTATTFTYPVATTEPVWHCTSGCPDEGYGIIASPYNDVTMGPGIISPPAGYAVLTIGSDGLPSPGPCTIGVPKPSLTHAHRTWPLPSFTGQSTPMATHPVSHSSSGHGSHPSSSGPHPNFSTASSGPTGGYQGSSSAAGSGSLLPHSSITGGSGTSWLTHSCRSSTVDGPHESNPLHTSSANSSPKTSTATSTSKTSTSNDPSDSLSETTGVSNEPTDSPSSNDSSHTTGSSSSTGGAAPAPTPIEPPVGITNPVTVLITETLPDGATTITEVLGSSNGGSSLSTTTAVEPTTTLDPGGSDASSSAVVLLGHISKLHDPLDKYISSSNMPAVQTSAITEVVSAGHVADNLKNLLPDDTNGGGPCSSGGLNLFKSIGNAVSCAVNSIKDITRSISGSEPNIDIIKSQLSNLDNIVSESENENDEDDDDDDSTTTTKDDSSTKTEELTTTTDLSSSTEDSSSSTSTCTATEPVSSCTEACTVMKRDISSSLTTSCTSSCFTIEGCTASATTVESTTTESSPAITPIVIHEPAELVLDLLEGVTLSSTSSVSATDESSISTSSYSSSQPVITPLVVHEPAELVLDLLEGVTLSSSHGSTTNPPTTTAPTTASTHTSHTSQTHPLTTFISSYTTSTSSITTITSSPDFPVVCFPRLIPTQCQCNGTTLYVTPTNSDGSCPQPTGKTAPSYTPQDCYIRDWNVWNFLAYLKCEAEAK